jgi:phosphomannomutase/phosphoglucomutase
MNPGVFRAYDVRGLADQDLTSEFAQNLGQAYGTRIRRDGGKVICLGRDCRLHGGRLLEAFEKGVLSTGINVLRVGVVASPLLYFSVHHYDTAGGVQITGSHNPPEYNGFKMMRGKDSLYGEQIQALRRSMETRDYEVGSGVSMDRPIFEDYVRYVVENIELGPRKIKIAVDGGNGTGGPPAAAVFQRLGVDIIPMYLDMDGHFPNHHPDPTVEENLVELKEKVCAEAADAGFAYDGDADRIGLIDERGQVIWGDRLLILLAREILREHPGTAIVGEVKCSETLFDAIRQFGGRPVMSAVGHSIIKERMKKEGALLAGEMSGHIFFAHRWFGFDDAIYTSARILELLSHSDCSLSELLSDIPETCVTPEIRLDCPDERKFSVVEKAISHFRENHDVIDIDGARIQFQGGWGLIRASNTQPVLVLRAEADSDERLAEIRGTLETFVAAQTGM